MQTIARELQTLVFKLDHMVQTLNFLGFLDHLATLTIIARGKVMKECRQELCRLHKRITIT